MEGTPGDEATRTSAAGAPRQVVAKYSTYPEAERAVDKLSDSDFPVGRVAIVGTGLKLVEQVAGRTTTGKAALGGAASGAMIGALFALFLGLFFTIDEGFLGLLLYGILVGVIFGATFAAIGQAMYGGRRDFTSVQGMQAETYEIQVDDEVADQAREILATL
jgi:hypothetical protein